MRLVFIPMSANTLELFKSLPILMLLFGIGWLYSFQKKTFAWLDFIWSISFLLTIFIGLSTQLNAATITLGSMYLLWSLRLSTHLFKRIIKHGEDKRYIDLKRKWKVWYGLYFLLLFQAEAVLTSVLSWPLFLSYQSSLETIHFIAIGVFAIAIIGEMTADYQLKKFLEKNSRNEVCNVGLWKYSRHPNYFFEWLVWVSFAIFSLSSQQIWPGLIPAIIMFLFLTKITGIPPAEESSLKSKGEKYMEYQRKTNAFFPWFKKILTITLITISFYQPSKVYANGDTMIQQEKIKNVFNTLRADNLHILDDFYDQEVQFVDPIGTHDGLESIKNYYKSMYKNVKNIKFETKNMISNGNSHVYIWRMILEADGLNGGEPVYVEGNSHIEFNEQNLVTYHRDYFDMGEFIYEYIPVLGWTIKKIKKRLGGHQ